MISFFTPQKRRAGEDHGRRVRRNPMSTMTDNTLCDDCRCIDFNKIILVASNGDLQKHRTDGCFIASLNNELTDQSFCVMCRFFSSAKARTAEAPEAFQLRAYTSFAYGTIKYTRRLPEAVRSKDLPHLAVVPIDSRTPKDWLYSQAPAIYLDSKVLGLSTIFVPRPTLSHVDYSAVVSWLEYCKSKHKSLCNNTHEQIPGMKLLDTCSSKIKIVSPPLHAPYIALSYVWGSSKAPNQEGYTVRASSGSQTPAHLPKVVLDAIEVVRNLGYRYLWVDRYCINQHNNAEKETQIKLMDSIYRRADVTIVAAAGVDDAFGLPGVANTPRLPQPTIQAKDVHLISSPGHPQRVIQQSMWSKRAWTFQEGLLSSRLLFFTEHEVYFECHAMQCRESMHADLDSLHCKQGKLYASLNTGLYLGETSSTSSYIRSESKALARYYDLIQQHTTRCAEGLRYPADILASFTGIMNHLSRGKFPILQIWGVPLLFCHDSPDKALKSFIASLSWVHEHSIRASSKLPQRRLGFPSWTWAGWHGEARTKGRAQKLYTDFEAKVLGLQVETEPSTYVEFDTFLKTCSPNGPTSSLAGGLKLEVLVLDAASFIFRVNPQSSSCFTNGCITSTINPPAIDRKIVLNVSRIRSGRNPEQVKKWFGSKAELHLSEGPTDTRSLTRFFALETPTLALLGIAGAPSHKVESIPYIHFLVLGRDGLKFSRIGVMAVRSEWLEFINNFTLRKEIVCLS
jgi:hypothetical protein